MNIEIINIDKKETSLRLFNKDKNDLFELLDKKEYSDIKIIYKEVLKCKERYNNKLNKIIDDLIKGGIKNVK